MPNRNKYQRRFTQTSVINAPHVDVDTLPEVPAEPLTHDTDTGNVLLSTVVDQPITETVLAAALFAVNISGGVAALTVTDGDDVPYVQATPIPPQGILTPAVDGLIFSHGVKWSADVDNAIRAQFVGDVEAVAMVGAICNSFKRELLAMSPHTAADTYKIALYTVAAALDKSTTAYSATNEVSGSGYSAGGAALSGFSATVDGDTAILDWTTDPTWPASSITARRALIYNATRSNKAVAVLDFLADVTSTGNTFRVVLPAPASGTGLIRID